MIAGGYPGGVVGVWDVESGQQLTRIETGYGYRSPVENFFVSPDWQTLFASHIGKLEFEQFEKDGKRMFRWEFDGAVRAWDLTTGQLRRRFQHQPARRILGMQLSPDGRKFVTFEQTPGTYEGRPKRAVSIWDAESGRYHPLSNDLQSLDARFSPDGRMLAIDAPEYDGYRSVKLFDTATDREKKLSLPVRDPKARLYVSTFSPDGRLLVGDYLVFDQATKEDSWQCWVKWWDAATGEEVASFGDERNSFHQCRFSPDGQWLAAADWHKGKLLLFRVRDQQLLQTVPLGRSAKGERLFVRVPVFSPDGKWLALLTQVMPDTPGRRDELDVHDLPQPRIHLIEVAAGAIRETLIAPQGIAAAACFSPDGRTLATGGHGRVLLWDLAKVPAATDRAGKP